MHNLAELRALTPAPDRYLGPAVVVATSPTTLEVDLDGGARVHARPALTFDYRAQPGDVVLVIGDERGAYVIGLLSGRGATVLVTPGDLEIAAGGRLVLSAREGVAVHAPEVELAGEALRLTFDAVATHCRSMVRRVTGLVSSRAGEEHRVVEGAALSHARTQTLQTEERFTVNGREIHLG